MQSNPGILVNLLVILVSLLKQTVVLPGRPTRLWEIWGPRTGSPYGVVSFSFSPSTNTDSLQSDKYLLGIPDDYQ